MRIRYGLIMWLCIMFLVGCSSEPIIEDGFEKAVYEKYDSFADENGLGGTLIFIEGKISEIYSNEEAFVVSTDEGDWTVSYALGGNSFETKLQEVKGCSIKVYGVYVGKSEKLKLPVMAITDEKAKIVDAESETLLLDFWDYSEAGLKGEWVIPEMSGEKIVGGISYSEPVSWECSEKIEGDSKYIYYYPYQEQSSGKVYVYADEAASNISYKEFVDQMLKEGDVLIEEYEVDVAGKDGYYVRYSRNIDGVPYELLTYLLKNNTYFDAFTFMEINSISDEMEEFSGRFIKEVIVTDSLQYKMRKVEEITEENVSIIYGKYQGADQQC